MSDREITYQYQAVSANGLKTSGTIKARNEQQAYARIARQGLTVTRLRAALGQQSARAKATPRLQQIAVLRQLGVMIEARVEAIQALTSLQASAPTPELRDALAAALVALRSGSPLGECLQTGIPGLPHSTLALINAGEAGGCLAATLAQAVQQLEAEERINSAIKSALVYPAFLITAGLAAALVMLLFVIPTFADIIGDRRDQLAGMSQLVFWLGDIAQNSFGLALILPLAVIGGAGFVAFDPRRVALRRNLLDRIPVMRRLAQHRDRERWCRIMAFALGARIGIVEALALAAQALNEPAARSRAGTAARELRLGARVADAVAALELLDQTQLSMIRVGEETGSIPAMLERIAIDTEHVLHNTLKRLTMIVEQSVIVGVSVFVGLIVYGLISALTSVYETLGQ